MNSDLIESLTPIALAVISAVTAWQGKKLRELSVRFDKLSGQFRSAVVHIRDWQRWDRTGRIGDTPTIPDDLIDEV
ncbi:hypothetical protein [Williamsia sp.]|uniref:hypothetical protein n=1 Tax=Williamsia sp. TaxID=1872085 RepID=UPI002F94DF19